MSILAGSVCVYSMIRITRLFRPVWILVLLLHKLIFLIV